MCVKKTVIGLFLCVLKPCYQIAWATKLWNQFNCGTFICLPNKKENLCRGYPCGRPLLMLVWNFYWFPTSRWESIYLIRNNKPSLKFYLLILRTTFWKIFEFNDPHLSDIGVPGTLGTRQKTRHIALPIHDRIRFMDLASLSLPEFRIQYLTWNHHHSHYLNILASN